MTGVQTCALPILGAKTLTLSNAGGTYSGVIGGTGGGLTLSAGTETLSGANTYTGATTINGGTLRITNNAGLGGTAGGTIVSSGATLELSNVSVGAETITLAGGTLRDDTSSLAGNIILTANSYLTATNSGDTLALSGSISGSFGLDRKSTRLNSSHIPLSRMPSSA